MKIFQVITVSEYGGAQTVVASLLEEMGKEEKNELFVLSMGKGESWQHLDSRIKRICLGKQRKEISFWDLILFFKLLYYRFKYNPDIVHLHSSKMGVLGRLAFPRRKIIITMHGFDSVRKGFPKFLIIEKMLKNRTKVMVGISKYEVKCFKEEGFGENVTLVYNGIKDHTSEKWEDTETIKKLKEIKQQFPKMVLCIARISKQKKFDLFLEIAQKLPEYAFVWIGNKEVVPETPENVFCLGECATAYQNLPYTDIFILPTNYEGMPVSIIEALSFGKPVVASAVSGLPEVLNGKNGFAVENNAEAFAEKIKYLMGSEEVYKKMSEEARKSYSDHFTIDKMVNRYKEIFESMTN